MNMFRSLLLGLTSTVIAFVSFGATTDQTIDLDTWGTGNLTVPAGDTYNLTFSGSTTTATFNKEGNGSVTLDNQSFGLTKWYWKGAGNLLADNCNIAISGNFESYGNWNWQTNIFNDCTLTVGGTFANQCNRNRNYAGATVFNGGTYTFAKLSCDSSDAGTGAAVYVRGGSAVNLTSALYCSRMSSGMGNHARFVVENGAVTIAAAAEVALSWAFNVTSGALELRGGTFTAPYVGGGNATNDYVLGNGGTYVVNKAGTDALQAAKIEHFYLGNDGLTLSTDYANTTASAVFTNWAGESGELTKAGTGTLTLTGDGSTHAKTVVSTGALKFGSGVATHPAVEVAGGATLDLTTGKPTLAGLSFPADETRGTLLMNAGDTLEISGANGFDPSNLAKLTFVNYTTPRTNEVVKVAGAAGANAIAAWAAMPYDEVAEIQTTFDTVYDNATDTTTFRVVVAQDMTVKRQVTVTAGAGGSVDFQNGKYLVDTVLTIPATPDSGNAFIGWTGAPTGQELDNPLVVTVAGEDITLTANFQSTVSSGPLDLSQGDVSLSIGPGCTHTCTSVTGNSSANLTLSGGGTVILPAGDLSGAFATLTIDGVTVEATDGTSLGAGAVLIRNGGGIVFSSAFTLNNVITVESGSTGFISFAEGTTTVKVGKLITAGATFTKLGAGVFKSDGNLNTAAQIGNSRWICDEGEILIYGEKWGASGFYVEMHEGTVLRRSINVDECGMGNVVLRGAKLIYDLPWNSVNNDMLHAKTAHFAAGSFALQVLAATNGVPSYVTIDQAFREYCTLSVDVAEGAELNFNCNLRGSGSDNLVALKKTGAGKLRLMKSPYDRTSVTVAEGTLTLSGANVRLGRNLALVMGENAQIELEDGAVLDNAGQSVNALLAEAQVHLDASAIADEYPDGSSRPAVANLGSTGGLFTRYSASGAPYLTHNSFNGKPALWCKTASSTGLGSAGTTPNTNSELSVYFVANPQMSLFTFSDNNHGKDSTPICFTKDGVNDGPDREGSFRYKYLAANKFQIYFQGNDANPMLVEDAQVALSKGPFIDSVRRDATTASFCRWFSDSDVFTQTLTDQQYKNFNFFNCAIMAWMKGAGNIWQNSTCPMDMAEVLVFNRKLTNAEDEAVRGYLAKKWFNSAAAWPQLPTAGAVKEVAVTVPAGETGAVAMELAEGKGAVKLVKRGDGTLTDLGATDNGTEIVVEEGTLRYAPVASGSTSAAAIWFDAADTDAVTVEGGVVTGVRNKGRAGGTFTPRATAVTGSPTLGSINGVQAVQFDGTDDFLRLTTFTNGTPRQLYVYMVNQRDEYKTAAGFFSYSQLASDKNDDAQVGAVVAIDDSSSSHKIDAGTVDMSYGTFDNSVPVVDYYLVGDYTVLFGQVNALCTYTNIVYQRNIHGKIPSDADRVTTNDLFQIGARKNGNDVPRWFFKGKIGEVVVFEQPLDIDQLIELMDYFRAKWMGAAGSSVAPTWLTGRTAASGSGVKLTQKDGSTVEQNGPTVALTAYEAEAGAIWARSVASEQASPLFAVAGDIAIDGAISVALTPYPQWRQPLMTYTGSADIDVKTRIWPVLRNGEWTRNFVRHENKTIILGRKSGTIAIVR